MMTPSDSRPVLQDAITWLITRDNFSASEILKDDLILRSKIGEESYGTPLMTFSDRDALIDLYEELLDAYMYSMQFVLESEAESRNNPIDGLPDKILDCLAMIVNYRLAKDRGKGLLSFLGVESGGVREENQ